jgi:hypothetical protein
MPGFRRIFSSVLPNASPSFLHQENGSRCLPREARMTGFIDKHSEWTTSMRGDGELSLNGIHSQIVRLVWSAAWFRVVLRARELASSRDNTSSGLNTALHAWIDSVFLDSFLVKVRRLAGGDSDALVGKDACYSLSALLKDLKQHRHLLTREHLLSLDNLSFDISALKAKEDEYWREHAQEGRAFFIPPHLDTRRSEQRNAEIDYLCETTAASRKLSDVVQESVLEGIQGRLANLAAVCLYTNKFIAHAATTESRRGDKRGNVDDLHIGIRDLWAALENLCRAVTALDGWLIGRTAHAFLPAMYAHEWQGIDAPFVPRESVPILRDFWKQLEAEAMDWGNPSVPPLSNRCGAITP